MNLFEAEKFMCENTCGKFPARNVPVSRLVFESIHIKYPDIEVAPTYFIPPAVLDFPGRRDFFASSEPKSGFAGSWRLSQKRGKFVKCVS